LFRILLKCELELGSYHVVPNFKFKSLIGYILSLLCSDVETAVM